VPKKTLTILSIVLIGFGLFFWATYEDPNEKANELYVNACKTIIQIKDVKSYTEAYANYKDVKDCLEKITSLYPGTEVAVKLIANQINVANVNLTEYQKIEKELSELANAEQEPIDCAAYCALESNNSEIVIDIAESYLKNNNNKKTEDLLDKVIEGKEIKNNEELYLNIVEKLIKADASDKAIVFLDRISRESKAVKKQELARYYAKAGKIKLAIENMENEEAQWTVGLLTTVLRKSYETKAINNDKELKNFIFEKIEDYARKDFYVSELVKLLVEMGEKDKAWNGQVKIDTFLSGYF
jgi:hypothetical protein